VESASGLDEIVVLRSVVVDVAESVGLLVNLQIPGSSPSVAAIDMRCTAQIAETMCGYF